MSAETWRWGDLFDLEVPDSATTRALGDMVEFGFQDSESTVLLAAFSPVPGPHTKAVEDALIRFAVTRGFSPQRAKEGLEIDIDPHQIVTGRLAFVSADAAWSVLAMAWPIGAAKGQSDDAVSLVLAFCDAPERLDPIFDHAEALISKLQPINLVIPAALSADPQGEF